MSHLESDFADRASVKACVPAPCSMSFSTHSAADDERAEYEALVNAEDFVAILKLKASRQLSDAM